MSSAKSTERSALYAPTASRARRAKLRVNELESRCVPTLFPVAASVDALAGAMGFNLFGASETSKAGQAVAAAGDVNGDGVDDFVIGAPEAAGGGTARGQAFVVFGRRAAAGAIPSLSGLDGNNGFSITGGADGDRAGFSVAGAGDVNGDGLGDVVVGAPYADASGTDRGAVYVVYGRTGGFPATIDLGSADPGVTVLNGDVDGGLVGFSVSGVGDFDRDRHDDILVGAPGNGPFGSGRGSAFLVYEAGNFAGSSVTLDGSGTLASELRGAADGDRTGASVAGGRDVNGDSFRDLLIGAPGADIGGIDRGRVYIVTGQPGRQPNANLATIAIRLNGEHDFGEAGTSVAATGDSNGDGLSDVMVGVPGAAEAVVVFGSATGFPADVSLVAGYKLLSPTLTDRTGASVAGAGDLNGDGLADLVVGSPGFDEPGTDDGRANIVFGSRTFSGSGLVLGSFADGRGLTINGTHVLGAGGQTGLAVGGAGDINGDGFPDLLVASPLAGAGGNQRGQVSVVLGRSRVVAVGPDRGSAPLVHVRRPDGSRLFEFLAYPANFLGGVRVAVGDVTGDGQPDVITAPGAGMPGQVRVIDGRTRRDLDSLPNGAFPYGPAYSAGIFIAAGSTDSSGSARIVVAPQKGPNRPVEILDERGRLLESFFPYGSAFAGAVRVAAGQLLGDERHEVVTARGAGASRVSVWDPSTPGPPLRSFSALAGLGGEFVAVGDVDGDGTAEVVVGGEGSKSPRVRWFDISTSTVVREGELLTFARPFGGGVRVAVLPREDGTARGDILASPGRGRRVEVRRIRTELPTDSSVIFASDSLALGAFTAAG